mmetsp:Transcript_23961/g.42886  ORF Transcript_23961/g.42886 Transcript_23961/m.42886 type:complete len:188 (-) Transcript_23961:8-571(-)
MGPSALSSPSLRSATAAAAVILATGILLHQRNDLLSYYRRRRGMQGLLQLLWIGDFLPPNLRQSMDELDKVEERMGSSEEQLEHIEILVERARLESVDGSTLPAKDDVTSDELELKSQLFQQNPKLRTRIGIFSNKLDTLAAIIDSVKSHSDEEVKQRKKQLINRIVELMNELDRMIASFNLDLKDR